MMLMHPYTLWCTNMMIMLIWCDDAFLCTMITLDDDDAYPMMMMHTLWWRCYLMIHYDDACLMFSESTVELLVQWLMRCTMMYMTVVAMKWHISIQWWFGREQRLSAGSSWIGFNRSIDSGGRVVIGSQSCELSIVAACQL